MHSPSSSIVVLIVLGLGLVHNIQAAPTALATRDDVADATPMTTELAVRNATEIDTLGEVDESTGVRVKRSGCGCCGCGGCGCCCCRPCCCCCKPCCCCCKPCCCCCKCCKCCQCCTCCRCCRCCCCRPCCCGCCGCGCCGCGGGRKRRALQNLKIQLADKLEKERREALAFPQIAAAAAASDEEELPVVEQQPHTTVPTVEQSAESGESLQQ